VCDTVRACVRAGDAAAERGARETAEEQWSYALELVDEIGATEDRGAIVDRLLASETFPPPGDLTEVTAPLDGEPVLPEEHEPPQLEPLMDERPEEVPAEAEPDPDVDGSVEDKVSGGWEAWLEGRPTEGSQRMEEAWKLTEDDEAAALGALGAYAARNAAWMRLGVLDLPGARAVLVREASKLRLNDDDPDRREGRTLLAVVGAPSGVSEEAFRIANEVEAAPALQLSGLLAFYEGKWNVAERVWSGLDDADVDAGPHRWMWTWMLARLLRARGATPRARELLKWIADDHLARDSVPGMIAIEAELALVESLAGDVDGAAARLHRCAKLMPDEHEWCGLAGRVDLAKAVWETKTGEVEAGLPYFRAATALFTRYHLPWDEAECLTLWGRALIDAGRRDGAYRLEAASQVYDDVGAGPGWKRVLADASV
jgi:hypothetical protein